MFPALELVERNQAKLVHNKPDSEIGLARHAAMSSHLRQADTKLFIVRRCRSRSDNVGRINVLERNVHIFEPHRELALELKLKMKKSE